MPDENKFAKLREIGYRIPTLCGFCIYSDFANTTGWGTCKLHRYEHEKHDNPVGGRGVSIHATGQCPKFAMDYDALAKTGLGAHMEFFDDGQESPQTDDA